MKTTLTIFLMLSMSGAIAQTWKTLPKGVRIIGYRNIQTSNIKSNFNQFGSESPVGAQFRVDADTFNSMTGNVVIPGADIDANAYEALLVGEYKVDAEANVNVQGTGFGYGITDKVMFYAELAYYKAHVKAKIKRTAGNTYKKTAEILEENGGSQNGMIAENLRRMIDANEGTIQSVITNHYGYRPLGDWYGSGFGDMETGLMTRLIDRGSWGLLFYPGVILPTGRVDDPNILQDIGFGDGQFDFFAEIGTGYIFNDAFSVGTTLRYTYQTPGSRTMRIPDDGDFTLSDSTGEFKVKFGDRLNWMLNSTLALNDWISITPIYRFMYQLPSSYESEYLEANKFLGNNTDKLEHQVQLTTSFSSITPFLKKKFFLPAQININLVQTVAGKNVPNAGRFEMEFRMLF